jgi:hypothetical protein
MRAAQIESLFREVNSRLAELYLHLDGGDEHAFLCECGDGRCGVGLQLTIDEYARIRAHPRWFAVAPGHQLAGDQRVVESGERYAVVETATA